MIADRLIRIASRLVPVERRADWLERWRGELWAVLHSPDAEVAPWRFALGALPDAAHEYFAGWRDGVRLDGLTGDLRRAWRDVFRARGASCLTVAIVGIGAASFTSVVGLVDATILRTPPAIARAGELFQIGRGPASDLDNFSYPNVRDLSDALRPVAALAAYGDRTVVVGTGSTARVVAAQVVTPGFFEVTGVHVSDGRGTLSDAEPAVVLSSRYWAEHRHEILAAGRWIAIDGQPTPVAGVAADGFVGVQAGSAEPAMWLSLGAALHTEHFRRTDRGWSWLWTIGRRHPGVSSDAVRAAATAAHAQLAAVSAMHRSTLGARIAIVEGVGLRPADRAEAIRLSSIFLSAAALVLVVALANVVGLQLARAIASAPAAAMLQAIGATRARLVRGRLFELLILTAAGSAVAWIAAWLMTAFVRATLPYPIAVSLEPQWRAFLVCTLASMAIVACVSVAPLSRVTRPGSIAMLSGGVKGYRPRSRMTTVLVTAQLALSVALLTTCGLLMRSMWSATSSDPGFDSQHVLVATLRPLPGGRSPAVVRADLLDRARAVTGVDAVGIASRLPLVGGAETRTVSRPGTTGQEAADRVALTTFAVSRGFFDVLRVRFQSGDGPPPGEIGATSAIFTQAAATRLWPDGSTSRQIDSPRGQMQAAGIASDMKLRSLRGSPTPAMFVPIDATTELPRYLIARTIRRDAAADLQRALSTLSADVVVMRIEPYAPLIAASLVDTQTAARIALPLSVIAVVVSMAGLYGLVARRVVERRLEFGVRLALGATPASLVLGVLRQVAIVAGLGCAIGAILTATAGAAMRRLLFGVDPSDPVTLVATSTGVVLIAITAATLPARRAGRADPIAALRGNG